MKVLSILLVSGCIAATAALADVKGEIEIAQDHAGLAIKATNIAGVKLHLHHTINCLVGPNGDGFDAQVANPCAKAGMGAIPDTADAKQKTALQQAVMNAKQGLATDDMAAAQSAAKQTADAISSVN
jgi:hypothetical protein